MPIVQRTDQTTVLKNHEDRILALERAPSSSVYSDVRVLEAAADHVLFQGYPTGRTILELSWLAILDSSAVADPCYAGLLFNGDAIANDWVDEQEYRWNVGIPNDALSPPGTFVSVDSNEEFGVVGWITSSEASFGRIRFPAYSFAGGEWNGDSSVGSGDNTNPGVCSGRRDDSGTDFVLAALSMIALAAGTFDRQQFAAGSWFALTAY